MVDQFTGRYGDLLTGSYDCVDRVVLNAYFPQSAVMIAADLIAWTQTVLVHDTPALAKAEPKTLRYRCTSPPGSPAGDAAGCASTGTGAGPSTLPAITRVAALPQPVT